ncbi:branched-chain amino acid aminotransferase [Sandaracinobacter neustonicus]|uniref:Branched-chain-amino-acid aminotransferase n=1 Tax=Sandaracinobacter neustonicus TaxID=1715348 RepID=A0A501XKB1_9SPHN|nr:branched-chain amino acid aminotransferase [Sandaracinobacter neustonicus]TPE60607.1 branched-chain amino acid aminotransferase [Sandaracinobacter neustonicus]
MAFKHIPHSNPVPADKRAELLKNPGFGQAFTDHMVTIRYTHGQGWHDAEVKPRAPFLLDPAASVLHYAQEIFEGLKAYRAESGEIALFRPDANAERFNASANRLAMPELPPELFLQAVEELVRIDKDWVPSGEGSLYLRPFMFADEAFLGVRPANSYIFCVIACPVGPYFKGGAKPVKLFVSENYTRAAPGGTGAAKCGGNYAASLVAQAEAIAQGCDQVIFLDAAEHRWIEELGGMNIFFVFDDGTIVTPPLGGTILPGITRNSLIALAREQGLSVVERPYSLDEWRADAASGRLTEAFACGTAAVVASIGEVVAASGSFSIAGAAAGQVTTKLKTLLTGLQRGEPGDPAGWVRAVPGTLG